VKSIAAVHPVQKYDERDGCVGGDLLWHVSAPAEVLAWEEVLVIVESKVERPPGARRRCQKQRRNDDGRQGDEPRDTEATAMTSRR
jgi:hypothetical protein